MSSETCTWCGAGVEGDDGFRLYEPAGARRAAFCRLEHVIPWAIQGAHWEPGEPFQDVGLDGVAATFDTGEGDGVFTVSPGLQAWMDGDLRLHPPSNVDLYIEGGIRDFVKNYSAKSFDVTACYRCGQNIIDDAWTVIEKVSGRVKKPM